MLRSKFFTSEQVQAIVNDFRSAGLPPEDVAILEFAVKLTDHAYKVTPRDIQRMRDLGLTDEDIINVAAAAAQRNFYSKLLDALGAEPDEEYRQLEPGLRAALDVGRRIGNGQMEEGKP